MSEYTENENVMDEALEAAEETVEETEEIVEAEEAADEETEQAEEAVADARSVCAGVRRANPSHPLWADSLELHYIELMGWDEIGRCIGCTGSAVRKASYAALDWVDMVGIAAAREGCGQAALF